MPNIFTVTPTPEQKVAQQLDQLIITLGRALPTFYNRAQALIQNNTTLENEYGSSALVLDAFDANTATGLTSIQLEDMLAIAKAFMNFIQPSTISDATVEALITL
jgi:hypothetical protein